MFYKNLIRPILFKMDPELIHELTINIILKNFHHFLKRNQEINDFPKLGIKLAGIEFPNRIGLAAGVDKNAACIPAWEKLGFGFMELGTTTYYPQTGNDKPRLFRIPEKESILNRMGFNNIGAEALAKHFAEINYKSSIPIGINIGKSRVINTNCQDEVIADYINSIRCLQCFADYLVINVSSPNTPDLRDWEKPGRLKELLIPVKKFASKPLFVKISPDQEFTDIEKVMEIVSDLGLAGLIATNTTINKKKAPSWVQSEIGGISGNLLKEKSFAITQFIAEKKPSNCALISVGGISTADDCKKRFDLGVDLVQIYSGLIYKGPNLITSLNKSLASI